MLGVPVELVAPVLGTAFVVVLILVFERRRAKGIERDLRDEARRRRTPADDRADADPTRRVRPSPPPEEPR